ncbi:sigma-54-dependent transcriptional regulator [Desulfofustis limnaeus]|jgi:DNA-binding NtrC family response regulator|uniref:Acetoacetate metabolism regulatory protein AtoC n=1 Tax=Desulfofustis limnaeus TaxID=2740163 RepID=A0ABN6LYL5_9BACT|nr:sigma-54 dependent transcriptional regulator [Desulfofustis limnaeus]MDX9894697.1 sigma-54 dependent transcriptional regulator [Desulfofustis sp.]BDD85673.1 acetoacetate metabolism regulatory protein AtoC [Desulfofustis limnaeus]
MNKEDDKLPLILVVDDDAAHRTMLKANLVANGYRIAEVADGDQVLPFLAKHQVDLILLDMKMERLDGLATLSALLHSGCETPVIMLTAFSSVDSAVEAMKKGAFDYIAKPVDIDELQLLIERALNITVLREENRNLKGRLGERFGFHNIIGKSQAMQDMFETLAMVAPSDATVLITGESGTGKELVANALHQNSSRQDFPFIKLNCAALHENLLESELFGHEAGAFTGAMQRRKGRFELAHQGTLFLDEIGDMSLPTQAKILRVLQEGEFERLGGTDTIQVDVRLLAATHKDLGEMIKAGTFRQDLFFRLSVVPVHLPPLRERSIDVPELANHFLRQYAQKNRKDIKGFHQEALHLLMAHDWPGNIRELENTIERAVILCLGEQITPHDLPPQLLSDDVRNRPNQSKKGLTLRDMEREVIRMTLEKTGNNRSQAAKLLGVARQTLLNKIKEYGL